MIQRLSKWYTRPIAGSFLLLFYFSLLLPLASAAAWGGLYFPAVKRSSSSGTNLSRGTRSIPGENSASRLISPEGLESGNRSAKTLFIGGPSQPEMSSFKPVSADNMVNLFTGDFSYNIPLMDVGGYPVNIYYDGGISMEQEASWVGLGWNINPGNISRNMRGVPDDFNGSDTLMQTQKMKPNKTWGVNLKADLELFGIKAPLDAKLGVAFNNYLGPSLEYTMAAQSPNLLSLFGGNEKMGSFTTNVRAGFTLSSRNGLTPFAKLSMGVVNNSVNNNLNYGYSLSTSYNSRTGIKALQLSEQFSFNMNLEKYRKSDAPKDGNEHFKIAGSLRSATISFVRPSYVPALRMVTTNTAWSGHFQYGVGMNGAEADADLEVYGMKSEVADEDTLQQKPMVGYIYSQKALNNPDYVMDFTRMGDREVTPSTPVIGVPQYTYDVFSINGEGTGGTFRAYRNDLGYVRDNVTKSKDKSIGAGVDYATPGHYGANFNFVKSPAESGEWKTGNKLKDVIAFRDPAAGKEQVYFRNPGEAAVVDPSRISQTGGISLVRFDLSGRDYSPVVEPRLTVYDPSGKPLGAKIDLSRNAQQVIRNQRTQVISFLTASEAAVAGLDKSIRSYDNVAVYDAIGDSLRYTSIPRFGNSYRKAHHISQISVTEGNGRRYIYGIPVYNTMQRDFAFSVSAAYTDIPDQVLLAESQKDYFTTTSSLFANTSRTDGYLQATSTPAYAHSFLLSGLLSSDYVDIKGDGITEDDLGTAVKFNYTMIQNGTTNVHRWRAPFAASNLVNFNAGTMTEKKDDKAMVTYGERESWYLSSIESKSMIAFFYVSSRYDGAGAAGIYGGRNDGENMLRKLDSIVLYNKADLRKNKLSKAKAVKKVVFQYSYTLCNGTPDNGNPDPAQRGKLTLEKIYFSYNGSNRAVKNPYRFYYGFNPDYRSAASDRWGGFKPDSLNPAGVKNRDYPYVPQDSARRAVLDSFAGAWMLNRIVLPSGGQMDIRYEADDYGYVQNKRAANMMQIAGFGTDSSFATGSRNLYPPGISAKENDYVFVRVPKACQTKDDVYNYYLQGAEQLAFKVLVQMPKGNEYVNAYAKFDAWGRDPNDSKLIWIRMSRLGGLSPVSLAALEFLRQQLPGQAYTGFDVKETEDIKKMGYMLISMMKAVKEAFKDPVAIFKSKAKAMRTDLSRSFVRLNDPDGTKYGGGYRVRSVTIRDNWDSLTNQKAASYGQLYEYTTEELLGKAGKRMVSSGVASYEPAIGGDENPFQTAVMIEDKVPAGPSSWGAVEMPILDGFFPAPVVGYSKVTVRAIGQRSTQVGAKSRSGVGRQVTEFYTAKDFPVKWQYTTLDAGGVKEFKSPWLGDFFSNNSYQYKTISQGFLVVTNDMHGKMKSQSSYSETDPFTRISYTENFYRNTGANGLNDQFTFIRGGNGGDTVKGNIGVDIELMTDTREHRAASKNIEVQGQLDYFTTLTPPFWPFIWFTRGSSENIYRSVTTVKTVSFHGILDSVVVVDKGSMVSTRNLAYDDATGQVLVTRTQNEFNKPVYNASYPAYWAYPGMGLAYLNTDLRLNGVNFLDGVITTAVDLNLFESGDEILVYSSNNTVPGNCEDYLTYGHQSLLWVVDKNKNLSSLGAQARSLLFVDEKGRPFTRSNVSLRVIRSGHRNMLDAMAASFTAMNDPLTGGKLYAGVSGKVVNASAVEFREKWMVDNDVIQRVKWALGPDCVYREVEDSTGNLESMINPYRKGLLGNFRPWRSMVYYGDRSESDATVKTRINDNGFLAGFKLYWDFNAQGKLIPDTLSTSWVWNSKLNRVNAKGLETETVDALGIYTAAQYGYGKSIPVAIASNARSQEMFADGFEDYGYAESINSAKYNFGYRHIDFRKAGATVINADDAGIRAHSGKYMIGVTGTALLTVPVTTPASDFSLNYVPDNYQKIFGNPLGGKLTQIIATPSSIKFDNVNLTYNTGLNSGGVDYSIQPYIPSSASPAPPVSNVNYTYMINATQYFLIPENGTYIFNFKSYSPYQATTSGSAFPQFSSIAVLDTVKGTTYIGTDLPDVTSSNIRIRRKSFCLNKGIYYMNVQFLVIRNYSCTPSSTGPCTLDGLGNQYLMPDYFSIYADATPSVSGIQFFRNYTTEISCPYTIPAPGTASMLHPIFSVEPGKRMLFSAWVKEPCGTEASGIPCREYTYTHSQVQLKAARNSTVFTIYPKGPIVEGWQRMEGEFTLPAGADTLEIRLINSGGGTLYFDDMRVHPYNANVKSYVYDPVTLRLLAELDANNYASFYEYDEEGTLIRTKVETQEGVKTVTETRSSLQKKINKQ